MTRLIAGLCLILLLESAVPAQEHFYTTLSTTLPKSVAMGGANTTVPDDPLSIGINPATLRLFPLPGTTRAVILFNPVGFYALSSAYDNVKGFGDRAITGIRLLVRFVGVSHQFFDLGIRLSDESYSQNDQTLFPKKDVLSSHTNTALLRLKLHAFVSFGVSVICYTHRGNIDQFGYSYGVWLRPGQSVQVGVSYLDNPEDYQDAPHPLERLADETINIGMSLLLFPGNRTSFDLRNITDENKIAFLEPHLGIEQVIFRHVALRGGGFLFSHSDRKMLTCGVGLLDWNYLLPRSRRFATPNYVAQYGVALEYRDQLETIWHTLSFCIRF